MPGLRPSESGCLAELERELPVPPAPARELLTSPERRIERQRTFRRHVHEGSERLRELVGREAAATRPPELAPS